VPVGQEVDAKSQINFFGTQFENRFAVHDTGVVDQDCWHSKLDKQYKQEPSTQR
jgi:hypothetical protein